MRRTFWNPFVTYTLACAVVVLVYMLGYSSLYPELSLEVSIFLTFSVITAVLFSLLVMGTPLPTNQVETAGQDWLMAGFLVAGFAAEFAYFGGVPIVQSMTGSKVDYQSFGIPTFHVVLIGLTYFFSVYWWDCYLVARRRRHLLISMVGFVAGLLMLSRGAILIILLSFVFAYGNRVGLRRRFVLLGSLALAVVLGFGYLGEARVGAEARSIILTMGGANEAFAASGLPEPVFWFYLYVSSPLANLQYTELHRPVDFVQWLGVVADFLPDFVSRHILSPQQFAEIGPELVTPGLTVGTAYARPLMNLGWVGSYALHALFLLFFYFCISFARGSRFYGAMLAFLSALGCLMFFDNMLSFAGGIGPVLVGLGLVALQRVKLRRPGA